MNELIGQDQMSSESDRKENQIDAPVYQALVEAAPDAMVVIDSAGIIILINRQFELLFGYNREELIGQTMEILVPDAIRDKHHVFRDGYFAEPKFREMGSGLELRARKKDGSEFPVEISLSPLQTSKEILATASIRDITERRKASERFRALLETAPDAMVIVNSQGEISLVNQQAEKMFGYPRDEMMGKNVSFLMPDRFRQTHGQHIEGYFRKPNVRPMGRGLELYGVRKDGSEFPIEISLSPIETEQGLNATAAIRDITERRLAERKMQRYLEKIEQSNRDLEQFAHVASHDLREPLRKIRTFCDRLETKNGMHLNDDGREYLRRMKGAADRMSLLMENLLEYSRLTVQRKPFEPIMLNEIVHEVISDLETIIEEKHAKIIVEDLPVIHADTYQMRRLFQNLISNALKFHHEGESPVVRISAEKKLWQSEEDALINGEYVDITVEDEGIGISKDHQKKIFGMFQRLHNRTEYEGTGVGLAICERIINQHNGEIKIDSNEGEGSRFIVSLPAKQYRHEELG